MRQQRIKEIFDQQALDYDKRNEKTQWIRQALYFLAESVFSNLPRDARVLCVGAGTGDELSYFAKCYPEWRFTVVEPSPGMMQICREKSEKEGYFSRCTFHLGFLDSLSNSGHQHHAATCFMVSQFLLNKEERSAFFQAIACNLLEAGVLVSADLSADTADPKFDSLTQVWMNMLSAAEVPEAALLRAKAAWKTDVAILPAPEVESIIAAGGFHEPILFYQAALISAWYAYKA